MAERLVVIAEVAERLRGLGTANFLYSDSDALFVHADHRTQPGSDVVLPGLHVLARSCEEPVPNLAGSGVTLETASQALTLVASVPLTTEDWRPMARGEVLAIADGRILERYLATPASDVGRVCRPHDSQGG